MRQAIVICTTPLSYCWLNNLLKSLKGYDKYPIIILSDFTFELGKIKFIYENTKIDEFLLLHDSCEIKDVKLFDIVFERYKGISICFDSQLRSYLVKYRTKILDKMVIPIIKTKIESVIQEEVFNWEYAKRDRNVKCLFGNFDSSNKFIDKCGRKNMVLENKYLIKYKGTWHRNMIKG